MKKKPRTRDREAKADKRFAKEVRAFLRRNRATLGRLAR